jgi:hypothetical protein
LTHWRKDAKTQWRNTWRRSLKWGQPLADSFWVRLRRFQLAEAGFITNTHG